MSKRKVGENTQLPKVFNLGMLIAALGLLCLAIGMILAFSLNKKQVQSLDFFLTVCLTYPTVMIIPSVWLMMLGDNPRNFFTKDRGKQILLLVLWFGAILFAAIILSESWRSEFIWIVVPLFLLSSVCLAIINYYRNYFRKIKMLLTGK